MALDLTKPVQTRDGRSVRLGPTDGRGSYAIIGFVGDDDSPHAWQADGRLVWYLHESTGVAGRRDADLINVPEKPRWFSATGLGNIRVVRLADGCITGLWHNATTTINGSGPEWLDECIAIGALREITEADANALLAEARKPKVRIVSYEVPEGAEIVGPWVVSGRFGDNIDAGQPYQAMSGSVYPALNGMTRGVDCRPLQPIEQI